MAFAFHHDTTLHPGLFEVLEREFAGRGPLAVIEGPEVHLTFAVEGPDTSQELVANAAAYLGELLVGSTLIGVDVGKTDFADPRLPWAARVALAGGSSLTIAPSDG